MGRMRDCGVQPRARCFAFWPIICHASQTVTRAHQARRRKVDNNAAPAPAPVVFVGDPRPIHAPGHCMLRILMVLWMTRPDRPLSGHCMLRILMRQARGEPDRPLSVRPAAVEGSRNASVGLQIKLALLLYDYTCNCDRVWKHRELIVIQPTNYHPS